MQDPQSLKSVAAFHKLFGHPIGSTPQIPVAKRAQLRIDLLQEELDELKEAVKTNDLVECADALADLQYVLSGAILEFGMGEVFKPLFDEVQRSNMSKACETKEIAEATLDFYKNRDGTEGYIKEKEGVFLVYRKEDDKTLKSAEYSPADLESVLKG